MDLKDAFDNIAKTVTTAVDNVKDAVSEATHRNAAEAEQTKRDVAGDTMPVSEKAQSVANQVKHETLAEVDATKQELRKDA